MRKVKTFSSGTGDSTQEAFMRLDDKTNQFLDEKKASIFNISDKLYPRGPDNSPSLARILVYEHLEKGTLKKRVKTFLVPRKVTGRSVATLDYKVNSFLESEKAEVFSANDQTYPVSPMKSDSGEYLIARVVVFGKE
ncbi:MAG: hypothetical protein Q8N99_04355 [Nanoarchaeota archaeon]|nr:hypothetical protein [Nanoarchaeota archaeon]